MIRIEREGAIAVVVMDNPPVNAASQPLRKALLDAVREIDADAAIAAAVLTGAGRGFMGGADIREFDRPPLAPQLPEVIAALMDSPKPWIAAIHGAALGGGLELALGCDVRIAAVDAVVGLPEVTLGIIPGAGGTQHLPRLVGIPRAIDFICSARRLTAQEAFVARIVDEVVRDGLRGAAVKLAGVMKSKHRIRDLPIHKVDVKAIRAAEEAALAASSGRQIIEAIASIKRSAAMPYAQALQREREAFLALRASPEAARLRRKFFEARSAAKGAPR
ncbi:MAG TPA: enoyl-CoA hydratase/isomerase family protein [Usitatibacter sp.]|nr:enoyl-CoA hydratase/isomerase family protein [Usitatibacter sp.]